VKKSTTDKIIDALQAEIDDRQKTIALLTRALEMAKGRARTRKPKKAPVTGVQTFGPAKAS